MAKTYEYQESLPPLPVPDLSESAKLYLKYLKPLVDAESYERTRKIVRNFLNNEGRILQNKLMEYADSIKPKSWLMPYSRDIYLDMRKPIPIEGNFLFELAPLAFSEKYDYLGFVAVIAYCTGLVFLELKNQTLPPMFVKDVPCCMEQFKSALRGTKIPREGKDEFVIYDYEQVDSFGVFYKNKFYAVRLIHNGTIVSCAEIRSALSKIYNDDSEGLEINFNTAGFMGSDRAARLIEKICLDEENAKSFDIVNKTMFHVALCRCTSSERGINEKLYSDTVDFWPYKPWSMTVFTDKICCFNFEHTSLDGLSNVYLIKCLLEKMKDAKLCGEMSAAPITPVRFHLDSVYSELKTLKNEYLMETDKFSGEIYIRNGLPVEALKKRNMNVDFYLQLAYQYAQLKAFEETKCTHESVSVTQYREGRTSCVRTASEEIVAFVDAFDHGESDYILLDLLSKAAAEQKQKILNAKRFCCFIRHAAGLNIIYERFGAELGLHKKPEVFTDPNFIRYCTQEISTSAVGDTMNVNMFAFAPQTEHGLGIGYVTHGDSFTAAISFWKSERETFIKFKNALTIYFDKMEKLWEG